MDSHRYIICGLSPAETSKLLPSGTFEVFGDNTESGRKLRTLLGQDAVLSFPVHFELQNVVEDKYLGKDRNGRDLLPSLEMCAGKLRSLLKLARDNKDRYFFHICLFGTKSWSEAVSNLFLTDHQSGFYMDLGSLKHKEFKFKFGVNSFKYDACKIAIFDHPSCWPKLTQNAQLPVEYYNCIRTDYIYDFTDVLFKLLELPAPT